MAADLIAAQPRTLLANLPTPLRTLPRLQKAIGALITLKRDDMTGLELSGNKVRKLEFLLGQALEDHVDTVITVGGIQSNHCRATVAAARQLGMEPHLFLRGKPPQVASLNLFQTPNQTATCF
eukprot:m.91793 g.91793  ORF g.91793 m.91793 type:complete len:123 (+) comp21679_c0_seq3:98-466(+)